MFFLAAAITAGIITFFLTPLVIAGAHRFKLLDNPDTRHHPAHTHTGTIPRAGGLAILVGLLVSICIFIPPLKAIIALIVASSLTVGIGLLDDKRDISPYLRFLGNIVTAAIVVGGGVGIPFITNPVGGVIQLDAWRISFDFIGSHSILVLADLFAIIWIVWNMNMIGWSSGVDGQMPGFVAIAAIVLGVLSLRFSAHDISQTVVATLAFITAGAYLGFLPWNYYPQKIMPGYGGKSLAGLLLATIAILSGGKVGSALLLLALPAIDAVYTLIRRIMNKKSPFKPDRHHLHHRLLEMGWNKKHIAYFYWTVSALLGIIALSVNSTQKLFTFALAVVIIGGSLYWVSKILTPKSA